MAIVARYSNPITARQAAAYLTANGVIATSAPVVDPFQPGAVVEIGSKGLIGRAKDLIRHFDLLEPQYQESLESQAEPDLSKLPRALLPPCPSCGRPLPPDASVHACPGCGVAVNVVELIVELHGPEALGACFPVEPDADTGDLTDEQLERVELACTHCKYSLAGLENTGVCPECGGAYDKRTLVGMGLGSGMPPSDAYPSELADEQIVPFAINCPFCDYGLAGLPVTGTCPECGGRYNKREMLG